MQLSLRRSLQTVRPRAPRPPRSGTRRNIVCRMSGSASVREKFVEVLQDVELVPFTSRSAAIYLVPMLSCIVVALTAYNAGLHDVLHTDSPLFFGPIIFGTLCGRVASDGEILESTSNECAQLKPFLMQCSNVLQSRNQNEVKVFAVGPEGELIRYWEGDELNGLLNAINKVVVRIE